MAGNDKRRGAVRKTERKGSTKGSGGQVRRGLKGKKATPKAEDRVYHAKYKAKKAAERETARLERKEDLKAFLKRKKNKK